MLRSVNKGFQLTFANGLTASVMFGFGNYCSNRHKQDCQTPNGTTSETGEMVVWGADGEYLFHDGSAKYDGEDECVCPQSDVGWKSADQIVAAMALVATFPSDIPKAEAIRQIHECFRRHPLVRREASNPSDKD